MVLSIQHLCDSVIFTQKDQLLSDLQQTYNIMQFDFCFPQIHIHFQQSSIIKVNFTVSKWFIY